MFLLNGIVSAERNAAVGRGEDEDDSTTSKVCEVINNVIITLFTCLSYLRFLQLSLIHMYQMGMDENFILFKFFVQIYCMIFRGEWIHQAYPAFPPIPTFTFLSQCPFTILHGDH